MTCWPLSSNLSQQISPTAEITGIFFLRRIVLRKYMPIISAVGLFCCDKFEETPNEKVINTSKLTKPYFSTYLYADFSYELYNLRSIISFFLENDHCIRNLCNFKWCIINFLKEISTRRRRLVLPWPITGCLIMFEYM